MIKAAFDAPPTDNLMDEQVYLEPAPEGVDARYAWRFSGGRGEGVRGIDIESDWNFQHDDLLKIHVIVVYGDISAWYRDPGTAVLGIIGGDRNDFGVVGVAAGALLGAASADYDATGMKCECGLHDKSGGGSPGPRRYHITENARSRTDGPS